MTLGSEAGGLDILTRAEAGGSLQADRLRPDGTLETLAPPSLPGGVSMVLTVEIGSDRFVLAVSADGRQITSLEVRNNGSLLPRGSAGADAGLGVAGISALSQVSLPDGDYVVAAAQGSSTLSVLRIDPGGALTPVDQVLDDLNTRFQNVTALETVTVGNRSFVLAGGADDGVSLFELLPGGRLLHLSTMADDFTMGLGNVVSLAATVVDGDLQIFAGSATETGVTQLTYDLGTHGVTRIGGGGNDTLTGGSVGDLLSGGPGNDRLEGRRGRDVLMDGAGADTFVLAADGDTDRIMDFDPVTDRIDLSAWPMLRNLGQITLQQTADGAILSFGDEVLQIVSVYGLPFSAAEILTPDLIGLSRVPVSTPQMQTRFDGTDGSDILEGNWSANVLYGLNGDDTLSGGAGDDRVRAGGGNDLLAGDGGNDSLFGQAGDDTLSGGDGFDSLLGQYGNDTLNGGNGNDVLNGGPMNDVLYGDGGNDTLDGATGSDWLDGGDGADELRGGKGQDSLFGGAGNDLLTGGLHSDVLDGGAGNDTLWGQDGYDTLVGGDHPDDFVFADGFGRDNLTAQQVVDTFGRISGNSTVLDFGNGQMIILSGLSDMTALYDDIVIF